MSLEVFGRLNLVKLAHHTDNLTSGILPVSRARNTIYDYIMRLFEQMLKR